MVENMLEDDAAVTLAQAGRAIGTVYARHGTTVTLIGVPDGAYEIYYTTGQDWDTTESAFKRSCTFEKLVINGEESPNFVTLPDGTWTTFTVTLDDTPVGNATVESVARTMFPR